MSIDIEEVKLKLEHSLHWYGVGSHKHTLTLENIKALEQLHAEIEDLKLCAKNMDIGYKHAEKTALKTIARQQAEIEQLEKESEWISVDDALPEDDGGYLTCVNHDDDFYINYFINYFGDEQLIEWTTDQEITHWKPLPKPPIS